MIGFEGWLVGLGQEGVARGWGNYLKYLKRGCGTEKRGGETKILEMGGKLGQGVGALKNRGLEPPYELWIYRFVRK